MSELELILHGLENLGNALDAAEARLDARLDGLNAAVETCEDRVAGLAGRMVPTPAREALVAHEGGREATERKSGHLELVSEG